MDFNNMGRDLLIALLTFFLLGMIAGAGVVLLIAKGF